MACIENEENEDFKQFMEPKITFKPTYKMLENQDSYKPLKTRTPSWTDRILYSSKTGGRVEVLKYKRTETYGSDHRYSILFNI